MFNKLRKRILEVAYRDEMGHIPSALSIVDIVWTLYDKVMTPDDRFILSKGHGCMALYAVLEKKGLLNWDSKLQGHPKRGGAILASTGSLGHGLPMAVGIALAKKIKGEKGIVYCLIGDGECNEGTTWESAMVASHHDLDNLVIIVDQNQSSERALSVGDMEYKFSSFGCKTMGVYGHTDQLEFILTNNPYLWMGVKQPKCIISENTKGKGVPFMENNPEWHNKKITKQDYEHAISIL